jgi:uncharacterized membrane protein YbaN (DUF454 family)
MLTMFALGVVGIVLLNLLAIVLLLLSYAWNDWLRPRLAHRRARQSAFERLIAQSTLDIHAMISEPSNGAECWEW